MASPNSTTDILVTWQRPIASGTMENALSYKISINDSFLELLDNSTTMYLITSRAPGVNYTIQVCVCVCVHVLCMWEYVRVGVCVLCVWEYVCCVCGSMCVVCVGVCVCCVCGSMCVVCVGVCVLCVCVGVCRVCLHLCVHTSMCVVCNNCDCLSENQPSSHLRLYQVNYP